nr:calcineurin-like phosphoesterase C-terminal domain-containing protein [Pelagicoccus albus]
MAVSGVVYSDLNKNGKLDSGEPGIEGVLVTNGNQVLASDESGHYELTEEGGDFVFVVIPNGWETRLTDDRRPLYYHDSSLETANFPLWKTEKKSVAKALVLADTQTYTETDVGYLRDSTVEAILASGEKFDFGVTLGDVVNDDLSLLPKVNRALSRIDSTFYYVNGNHDLDFDAVVDGEAVASFEALYGPANFAFESGPALFIGLDDVRFPVDVNGRKTYIGGLREDQFVWLENLLAFVPKEKPLVLMAHIPMFQPDIDGVDTFRVADRERLFDLLKGRTNSMFLSGHTHYQRHYFHEEEQGWVGESPLHEYNVAAACGSFWGGPLDENGIPVSTMWDGTPPGFAILKVTADGFRSEYRPTSFPADYQIGLTVPKRIKEGQGWVSFYANVFDGHEGWTVTARIDEREQSRGMGHTLAWDPGYVAAYLAQDDEGQPLPEKRLPDPKICFHLWKGYFPSDMNTGEHQVTVTATHPDGRSFEAKASFSVEP